MQSSLKIYYSYTLVQSISYQMFHIISTSIELAKVFECIYRRRDVKQQEISSPWGTHPNVYGFVLEGKPTRD
jgi:hypothetical protein